MLSRSAEKSFKLKGNYQSFFKIFLVVSNEINKFWKRLETLLKILLTQKFEKIENKTRKRKDKKRRVKAEVSHFSSVETSFY